MSGRRNREKGNEYEVELTHYLSSQLDVEVISSRNGRGGAQGGTDLQSCDGGVWVPHVRGWSIDGKWRKERRVPTWLRQVRDDAEADRAEWWCVFHRAEGTSDRSLDRVYLPARMLLDFLIYGQPTVERYQVEPYLEISLGEWCEVAS